MIHMIVKDLSEVTYAVKEVIKRAKEVLGLDEQIKIVDIDEAIEHDIEGIGLGVSGYGVRTLSPKQLVSRGTSLTFLVQAITRYIDPKSYEELVEGQNYFVCDINTLEDLIDMYKQEKEPRTIALDIETAGNVDRDPFASGQILSIAIYDATEDKAFVVPEALAENEYVYDLLQALQGHQIVCHNGTFDMPYLSHRIGTRIYHQDDTLLMHYVLFNTAQEHGLKPLAQRWLNAPDWDSANDKYLKGGAHYEYIPRKQLYLYNCIGEGSPVLTDRGLVPIENVQLTDKVWDGVEWVHHEGVVCKGTQPVIDLDGLVVTPEHLILTDDGDYVCAQSIQAGLRRPAVGGDGSVPQTLSVSNWEDEARASAYFARGSLHIMWEDILEAPQLAVAQGHTERVRLPEQREMGQGQAYTRTAKPLPRNGSTMYSGAPDGESTRGSWSGDALQVDGQLHYVGTEQLADGGLQRGAVRSYRHTRPLRAGEPAARICSKKRDESQGQRVCAVHGAKCSAQSSVAPSENGSSRLSTNSQRIGTQATAWNVSAGCSNQAVQRTARVYDILNAGPRHRFTVSGIVVSNCYDVVWTYRLYKLFHAMLEEQPEMRAYYEYRMQVSKMLQDVQLNGVPVDVDVLDELEEHYSAIEEETLTFLRSQAGQTFNPRSTKQLKEFFAAQGVHEKSFKEDVLKKLRRDRPDLAEFIDTLLKYRSATKVLSSYISTVRGFVGNDGRVHPTYLPHGAKTGRLSAKSPAIQTMGRDSGIKRALYAPEGYKIISCDYSQAELRTVAELSDDANMMSAFQPGAPDFFDDLMTKVYPEEFPTIADYEAFDRENHLEAKNKRALIKSIVYGCVPTHVLIRTYDGDKAWWELQEGERIPVSSCETKEATVTHINYHFNAPVYRYKLGEHYAITTANHRWPLKDGSFVEAKDLRAGHEVLTIWKDQTILLESKPDFDYLGRCDVWCPTTTSGTWVAVDNDRPFLTGNSNYGRGAKAIATALEKPVEDAEHVLDMYYSAYPNLKKWQDSIRESVGNDSLAWRTTTPFGLRFKQEVVTYKNQNSVGNEALAFVPQSTANDICLHAAIEINKRVGQYGAELIGLVHDATYVLCPEDKVEECSKMMENEMRGAARLVFHRVPFEAEAEVGDSWAEV